MATGSDGFGIMPLEFIRVDALMAFARLVIDLLLLRRGPQDMPGDSTALYGAAAAYCSLLFLQVRLIASSGAAVFQAVLATAVLALYARVLLRVRGYPNRLVQTLTALFSAGAVVTLLMLGPTQAMAPFLHAVGQVQDPANLPRPSAFAMLAYILLGFWGVAVYSHIYRNALNGSFWLGLAAAIGFEVILLLAFSVLG